MILTIGIVCVLLRRLNTYPSQNIFTYIGNILWLSSIICYGIEVSQLM